MQCLFKHRQSREAGMVTATEFSKNNRIKHQKQQTTLQSLLTHNYTGTHFKDFLLINEISAVPLL